MVFHKVAYSGIHPALHLGFVCLQPACNKEHGAHVNAVDIQRQQAGTFFKSS